MQHRRDAPLNDVGVALVLLGGREVGLVLLDRVPLVIAHRAPGPDVAGRSIIEDQVFRLPLLDWMPVLVEHRRNAVFDQDLRHELGARAVGIGVAHEPAGWRIWIPVRLAPLGLDAHGLAELGVAAELVGEPARRGIPVEKAVALVVLALHGRGCHSTERVECGFDEVLVRIGHLLRREHTVVDVG